MLRIEFTRDAEAGLLAVPSRERKKLQDKIEALAARPSGPHGKWWKTFSPTTGRIRQGDWRALYLVDTAADVLFITEVALRRDVYG